MNNIKALVLFSGGLDSMLAVKILQAQNIEVEALSFVSNFYNAEKAKEVAKQLDIKLHIIDIKDEMLKIVKNPESGYGKNLNPCIDCHGFMIKKAAEFSKNKFSFLATGEVLGQRPFSQNSQSLKQVERLAGVSVLRPLSAKVLPKTEIEEKGLVKRHKLFDIVGRARFRQIELAEKFGIKEYPSPAGGCLLTDPGFSERLGKMLDNWKNCTKEDVELLKYGRVFWLNLKDDKKVLVVVGRHKEDNEKLEKLAKKHDFMVELKEETGPVALARITNYQLLITNNNDYTIDVPEKLKEIDLNEEYDFKELINVIGKIVGFYSVKARGKKELIEIKKTIK